MAAGRQAGDKSVAAVSRGDRRRSLAETADDLSQRLHLAARHDMKRVSPCGRGPPTSRQRWYVQVWAESAAGAVGTPQCCHEQAEQSR
jgi:hypothetical protein